MEYMYVETHLLPYDLPLRMILVERGYVALLQETIPMVMVIATHLILDHCPGVRLWRSDL